MLRLFLTCLFVILALAGPAHADCGGSPGGTPGRIIYNADQKLFQYCNGTGWIAMNRPGSGTGGCTAPTLGEGIFIYNADYHVLEGCAGNVWRGMGPPHSIVSAAFTNGLVGYWRFDEASGTVAADSSGHGLNGTLVNGPTWQPSGGIQGGALSFDGTNDRVSVPDPGAGSLLDFPSGSTITITAWIRPTNASGCCQQILSKGQVNASNYYFTVERFGGSSSTMDFGFTSGGDYREIYGDNNKIQNNIWRFVAVTYSFGTGPGAIYVDGVSAGLHLYNGPYSRSPSVNNSTLTIGSDGTSSYLYGGLIDNLRIYNRILSAAEIADLYQYELNGGGCTLPDGTEGELIYNSGGHIMQYCDGEKWLGIGAAR